MPYTLENHKTLIEKALDLFMSRHKIRPDTPEYIVSMKERIESTPFQLTSITQFSLNVENVNKLIEFARTKKIYHPCMSEWIQLWNY